MRRDLWEVVGMALLVELLLRVVHAVAPIQTAGILPITGDDIKQTGIALICAVVGYGILRYLRLPPSEEEQKPIHIEKALRPSRLRRQPELPLLAPLERPSVSPSEPVEPSMVVVGPTPGFLAAKKADTDSANSQ